MTLSPVLEHNHPWEAVFRTLWVESTRLRPRLRTLDFPFCGLSRVLSTFLRKLYPHPGPVPEVTCECSWALAPHRYQQTKLSSLVTFIQLQLEVFYRLAQLLAHQASCLHWPCSYSVSLGLNSPATLHFLPSSRSSLVAPAAFSPPL